ncbi:hypothetical protein [Halobellus sp. EA9]|uniref:hypothetical protein n=1 Tax=Halobellus sp. EA9 TaxID=3421647 RepID=UPI003EBA8597
MFTENLPPALALALPQLGLIFVGILIERHYVSRVTAFANSLALVAHVATRSNVGFWFGVYADVGLLLGIVGILAYLTENSLRTEYYLGSLFLYSGLPVGTVILLPDQWVLALISSGVVTFIIGYFTDVTLAYTDRLDGAVYQYAKGITIEHTNKEAGYRAKINLLDALKND